MQNLYRVEVSACKLPDGLAPTASFREDRANRGKVNPVLAVLQKIRTTISFVRDFTVHALIMPPFPIRTRLLKDGEKEKMEKTKRMAIYKLQIMHF